MGHLDCQTASSATNITSTQTQAISARKYPLLHYSYCFDSSPYRTPPIIQPCSRPSGPRLNLAGETGHSQLALALLFLPQQQQQQRAQATGSGGCWPKLKIFQPMPMPRRPRQARPRPRNHPRPARLAARKTRPKTAQADLVAPALSENNCPDESSITTPHSPSLDLGVDLFLTTNMAPTTP